MSPELVDAAERRRSPATLPGYHCGRPSRNKGRRYPADPPTIEEIILVMRQAGGRIDGHRAPGLIVALWRAGLRISEALALNESDLDPKRGSILVRHGKGDKRRTVGMDTWAWEQLGPWLEDRTLFPPGAVFCVVHGPTARRPCSPPAIRAQLRRLALQAGVRRRFRSASTPPRTRRGDDTRRRPVDGHPTPAWPRRPRHHLGPPPRHRQQRDHRHRPRPSPADDHGQRGTQETMCRRAGRRCGGSS